MIARWLRGALVGRRVLQPLWERLHRWSLYGMNVAAGSHVSSSGEVWVLRHVRRRLGAAVVVLDVGANVGAYAHEVLRVLPGSRLYCFEPSKYAFERLQERYGGRAGVTLVQVGLGDREERRTLFADEAASGMAAVYARNLDHTNRSFREIETVNLTTLDRYCAREGIARIDLLKLDVEGHELAALSGAKDLLERDAIAFIQFEFGGCNIDSRTFFKDFFTLLNPHYRIHRVLQDGLVPIDAYRETCEVFLTTNFLAVSRALS